MSESTEGAKRPRRTAAEIAQGHADKALAAVEKHDEKIEKLQDKYNKARSAFDQAIEKRRELVAEADYRQAHPALRKPEVEVKSNPQQDEFDFGEEPDSVADDEAHPPQDEKRAVNAPDDDDNPFA